MTLRIRHVAALPVRELSALAVRATTAAALELLAAGDEEFALAAAALDGERRPRDPRRIELAGLLPQPYLAGGSGFEGVAADGAGTVFVLQEEESRILVLAPDLDRLLATVTLTVPRDTPGYGDDWHDSPNRRGEGLLLLEHGHVLIAKQKRPVRLIELGPAGDDPLGVDRTTVLAPRRDFALRDAAELVPLADWPLGDETRAQLPSINDVAAGDDGRVYLLSSESRAIGRLEERLEPGENARATDAWQLDELPDGEGGRPEGLALLPGCVPVVGLDSRRAADNLVVLEPPP